MSQENNTSIVRLSSSSVRLALIGSAAAFLLATTASAQDFDAQPLGSPTGGLQPPRNGPPTIVATQNVVAHVPQMLELPVTVDDPEGDLVSLKLLDPAPGVLFEPVRDAVPPVTRRLRWALQASNEMTKRATTFVGFRCIHEPL